MRRERLDRKQAHFDMEEEMIEAIITGWWKVLILLAGCTALVWGVILAAIHFLKKAKDAGIDEIEAGPVKVDFDDKEK